MRESLLIVLKDKSVFGVIGIAKHPNRSDIVDFKLMLSESIQFQKYIERVILLFCKSIGFEVLLDNFKGDLYLLPNNSLNYSILTFTTDAVYIDESSIAFLNDCYKIN